MEVRPIRNEADYEATLREVSRLVDLDPPLDSPDGERLDVLATLVQAHEARHYPIDLPDPIEAPHPQPHPMQYTGQSRGS